MLGRGPLVLLAVLGLAAAPAAEPDLALGLPDAVPAASVLEGWERIDGAFDDGAVRVRYRLYVDPARPLLYRITQFAVHHLERRSDGDRLLSSDPELVVWNETPGLRIPLRCYRRVPVEPAIPGGGVVWRPLLPGTADYDWVMHQSIAIYLVQQGRERSAAAAGGPP